MDSKSGWMHLHPAARILSLAFLTVLLAQSRGLLLLLAALPLCWMFLRHPGHMKEILRLARGLRWFFLSILILYVWFVPATPDINAATSSIAHLLPAGLTLGLERIAVLLIIVGYSGMLLRLSSREEIISGIYVLLSPLRRLRIDTDRMAVRLGLVLDYVPRFEAYQRSLIGKRENDVFEPSWIDKSATLFEAAAHPPESDEAATAIDLVDAHRAGLLDLLVPGVIAMLVVLKWI